jgi:hypothetical protein
MLLALSAERGISKYSFATTIIIVISREIATRRRFPAQLGLAEKPFYIGFTRAAA